MQLPSLPLVDGCLFVDNSMLELLTTCPRALEYNRFHKRVAATAKPSLAFGSAIHLALEHRYRSYKNLQPDAALESEIAEMLTVFFESNPQPPDDYRTLNWAIEIVRRYNRIYDLEPFQLLVNDAGEPMVELSFALPLFTYTFPEKNDGSIFQNYTPEQKIPVIYTGRIDLPVLWDNQLFVGDHKTTSMIGPSFFDKMKMSAQQKGYCWAFEELTSKTVSGYFINAIRVKEPPKSLGQEGGRTKTTEAAWWRESFQRKRYFLQPGELTEWKHNAIKLVEEMFYHYQQGYMPMKTAWCNQYGRCPYFDVCSLPQSDRGVALQSNWFQDNTWNPLKQPTTAKQ